MDDLERLYALLARLGPHRRFDDAASQGNWPSHGVYFFFEPGEFRGGDPGRLRIVRVGTHGVSEGSKSTLPRRMRQHFGSKQSGGGNHRGSIFRLRVGAALAARDPSLAVSTWGQKRVEAKEARIAELALEQMVSDYIRRMPFLLLPVEGASSKDNDRSRIERGAIALLTDVSGGVIDPPGKDWLGRHCFALKDAERGLWNNDHVGASRDPTFLNRLEDWVDRATGRVHAPATSKARTHVTAVSPTKTGSSRLAGKTALIIGAGQSPGETLGNGRATALRFAQEGARVLCVDRDLGSAEETARQAGNGAAAFQADVTREAEMAASIAEAVRLWGRLDILHYNVGMSLAGGDAPPTEITEEAFDRITAVNLRGFVMAVKHALPVMRRQESGVILSISSAAAVESYPYVAYKTTKAAMLAFTEQVAIQNAGFGIRCNTILPGLMDTPMAVDTRVRHTGKSRAEVAAERDAKVPLRRKMGTAWDVANAALFLASDEAGFITGVCLPVDGGRLVQIG